MNTRINPTVVTPYRRFPTADAASLAKPTVKTTAATGAVAGGLLLLNGVAGGIANVLRAKGHSSAADITLLLEGSTLLPAFTAYCMAHLNQAVRLLTWRPK